ncbi:hypothetical protein M885DRAFT_561545 [Pelagophyceae sp. CCMP2097]|nr:hypothetical protein M885DRAFT_561545 [Pelagophyceae sp. CCMP2097]
MSTIYYYTPDGVAYPQPGYAAGAAFDGGYGYPYPAGAYPQQYAYDANGGLCMVYAGGYVAYDPGQYAYPGGSDADKYQRTAHGLGAENGAASRAAGRGRGGRGGGRGMNKAGKGRAAIDEALVHSILALRLQHKMSRNFEQADRLRDELTGLGVMVHDREKTWEVRRVSSSQAEDHLADDVQADDAQADDAHGGACGGDDEGVATDEGGDDEGVATDEDEGDGAPAAVADAADADADAAAAGDRRTPGGLPAAAPSDGAGAEGS